MKQCSSGLLPGKVDGSWRAKDEPANLASQLIWRVLFDKDLSLSRIAPEQMQPVLLPTLMKKTPIRVHDDTSTAIIVQIERLF